MIYKAIFISWIVVVSLGSYYALAWSYTPGVGRAAISDVPVGNGLRTVILVHPDCPCTEASLKLYVSAVQGLASRPDTLVVIPSPTVETKNVALARSIPNSRMEFAPAKEILRRFGLSTSGHILIWNGPDLIFSGGVTDARGEEVMAASFTTLTRVLESKKPSKDTPVFGCAAFDKETVE